tara:strand:+ start:129446 stop:130690 length:1245 start_codon:yes stop_codon:yes gene_type:complete
VLRSKILDLDRVWAAGLLCLVASTWRLWIYRADAFEIPMAGAFASWPEISLWMPSLGLIVAALALLGGASRWLWWMVAACLVTAFLMNQHRLQPWAYQSAIYSVVFASMNSPNTKRWLRPLAASVYLYSAAGKFDFQFAHTVGQTFLASAMSVVGGIPESWSDTTRSQLALLFPAGELMIGISLLIPHCRKIAGCLAMVLHLSLLLALGPWGQAHSTGVLVWNILLVLQAYFLFVRTDQAQEAWSREKRLSRDSDDDNTARREYRQGSILAKICVMVALFAPLGERGGYWDHWPSWALYSPHSSRILVEVHESRMKDLTEDLRGIVSDTPAGSRWHELALDDWSLSRIGVPIYPQARFQLAVADRIATEHDLGDAIRVIIRGPSDRWTGRRDERRLIGASEIHRELQKYWIVGS